MRRDTDPPYPPEMVAAHEAVRAACAAAGLPFLCSWADPAMTMEEQVRHLIDEVGARIIGGGEAHAAFGRGYTKRVMPV